MFKKEKKIYKDIAERHNLICKEGQQIDLMKGFRSRLFRYDKTIKTSGVLEGRHQNHSFFIFTTNLYDNLTQKIFTVGSCEFGTTIFPHILLKSKKMPLYQDSKSNDRKISIEKAYLKNFDLYCPEDYGIEALQIFTEPLLISIQEISEKFSIEFGGNRIYVYINKNIQNKRNEKNLTKVIEIIKEIIDKTDGRLLRLKDDFDALDEYFKKWINTGTV